MVQSYRENSAVNAVDLKQSVRAATTGNITLSGAQTIDGVSVVAGDRVLVKNQTTASQNGIYVAASGSWARALDANESSEVTPNFMVMVEEGSTNADRGFMLTTNGPITLGSTSLAFREFTSPCRTDSGTLSIVGFGLSNTATGNYSAVSGGQSNTSSGGLGTISGGKSNTSSGSYSTVGGGNDNRAVGFRSVISGGGSNTALQSNDTVSGGSSNTASGGVCSIGGGSSNAAVANFGTISGGSGNTALGLFSSVSGGYKNTANIGSVASGLKNTSSGGASVVAGGGLAGTFGVSIGSPATFSMNNHGLVSGDAIKLQTNGALPSGLSVISTYYIRSGSTADTFTVAPYPGGPAVGTSGTQSGTHTLYSIGVNNRALGNGSFIGGGAKNLASGAKGTVGGGQKNTSSGIYSTVGGGNYNASGARNTTVGGGNRNTASGYCSTVGGGYKNTANASVASAFATVGGGIRNTSAESYSTVGGGYNNTAHGSRSVVAGGQGNRAVAYSAVIGGGFQNTASGSCSTLGGGKRNTSSGSYSTVGGGYKNASDVYGTVGGGNGNTASGYGSTVSGGRFNTASGSYSTAFGFKAAATLRGEVAASAGSFQSAGDAQSRRLILRNSTAASESVNLYLDGSSTEMVVPTGATWFYTIRVVARDLDQDESAGYKFEGLVENSSIGATLLGTIKTVIEDNANWDADVSVDTVGSDEVLRISCSVESGQTGVFWVAEAEIVQVVPSSGSSSTSS